MLVNSNNLFYFLLICGVLPVLSYVVACSEIVANLSLGIMQSNEIPALPQLRLQIYQRQ
jgi:hypothetical protein